MFTESDKLAIGLAMDHLGPRLKTLDALAEHAASEVAAKHGGEVPLPMRDYVAMHSMLMLVMNALIKSGQLNILELAVIVSKHLEGKDKVE